MAAFQFRFMALVVDVIDRCGPSNETRHQLQPKKTKVRRLYTSKRRFSCTLLLTRRSASILKVDVSYDRVKNGEFCCQL